MSIFLRTWCRKFTEEIFPEHVFLPKTKEDIAKAMGEYSILGLVGAICSMDVTHVRWDRCPYTLHNLYVNKISTQKLRTCIVRIVKNGAFCKSSQPSTALQIDSITN